MKSMWKNLFAGLAPLLFAVAVALAGGGCQATFGPVSIPNQYSTIEIARQSEVEKEEELRKLQNIPPARYEIASPDRFTIRVYEHPELETKDIVVTPDGYISAPLIGPVKIGGMTLVDANEELTNRYKKYVKEPLVSLIPLDVLGQSITVGGRVGQPGRYPLTGKVTRVTDAIALCRGLSMGTFHGDSTEAADLGGAYIVRNGKILPVDFTKAITQGNALHNIPLRDGDYIYIPSKMSTAVYVLGEVSAPTYVGFKDGLTVLQALSYARGFKEDSRSRYANIIRGGLTAPKLFKIDLDQIVAGKQVDFRLEPNDIVYVPRNAMSEWNAIVRQILPSLQALSMLAGPFGNPSSLYSDD